MAPWIPAIRATASASPFGTVPSRSAATHSAFSRTKPAAEAVRAVTAFAETSTIRASPAGFRCGKSDIDESADQWWSAIIQTETSSPLPTRSVSSGRMTSAFAFARSPSRWEPWPPISDT